MMLMFNICMAILLALYLFAGAKTGFLYNLLNVYLIGKCLLEVVLLIYRIFKGQLAIASIQASVSALGNYYWIQLIVQVLFFSLIAVYVVKVLPIDAFSVKQYQFFYWLTIGLALAIIVLTSLPTKQFIWPQTIVMTVFIMYLLKEFIGFYSAPKEPTVTLLNPFKQPAYIVHGGGSLLFNHHYHIKEQQWALDMVLLGKDHSAMTDAKLTQYPCYGANLYAPVSGEVAIVVDHLPDVEIGNTDLDNLVGNHVVIKKSDEQFIMLAHLKSGSSPLSVGQQVTAGETVLGQCGNSGNTTEPHLHMQVQNKPKFEHVTKTFPIAFKNQEAITLGRAKMLIK